MTDEIQAKKPIWKRWWLWIIIVFVVIIIISFTGGEKKERELTEQPQQTPQEQLQPEITDYNIQFTAEHISGRTFKTSGTTDLPDGAKIHITIYDENYFEYDEADSDWRLENLTYFGDSVIVKDEKFTKTLTALELEAPLKSDKYEVEVSFNPRVQTTNIKKIVGKDGEYLGGGLVNNEIEGLTTLETSKIIILNY